MSRRPTSSRQGSARGQSTASAAMPPPSKIPNRPPSSASITMSSKLDEFAVPPSPRKSSIIKKLGPNGKVGGGDNGEINIQVVVRCRGRSPQELATTSPIITTTSGPLSKAITIETTPMATSSSLASFTTASSYGGGSGPSTKTYPFDKVFGPEADQTMVFEEVAEGMLAEVLAGYNCTIFAYGQTGTGKTYTMQGDLELSPLAAPKDSAGIVPRVLHRLFRLLESADNTEFSVKCSYVELYNEEMRDLLSPDYNAAGTATSTANGGGLKLYEDGKKGTMIQGLEEVGVKNLKEALNVVNKGCQKRQVAETKMNTESSRSHTILSLTVHVKEKGVITGSEDLLKVGKFNLVDLAGSEAIGRSGATDKRAREAGMINQSLLTLGRVISALVEKGPHIPYRESKLTRLLQDSLGGKTKTCIVATVSPTRSNMEETLSTLEYAIRAKSIRNRPEVNQHLTRTGLLKEYLGDIERLKAEVLAAREKNGIYIPEEQWTEMQEDLARQKSEYEEAKLKANSASVELKTKKRMFDELSEKMLSTTADLQAAREAERQLGELLEDLKVDLEDSRVRLEEERYISQAFEKGEENLDRVAESLKGVAAESVQDVGGLFDKLARKAKVLGSNADAATLFGSDLQGFYRDLRNGLKRIKAVQGQLGDQVGSEMSRHAARGQEISRTDMVALETSFEAFTDLASRLQKSAETGHTDSAETNRAILRTKDDLQRSLREWAQNISDRNVALVEDVIAHQQEHLTTVETVLLSSADLVEAVIGIAKEHLATEAQAAATSKQLAMDTANAEMERLRSQNALLAKMLVDEKTKTARLRTELVQNLTNLVVGFTDAQDASWTSAVSQVQAQNEASVTQMQRFAGSTSTAFDEGSARTADLRGELGVAGHAVEQQRQAGQGALTEVRDEVRIKLETFGRESASEVERRVKGLDNLCDGLSTIVAESSSQAQERYQAESKLLASMSQNVSQTQVSSTQRTAAMCDDIASLTSTLLNTRAKASKTFDESHAIASSSLSSLMDRTSRFLSSEIQEDVPTGITPRKKVWNVPTDWERTEPREILIASLRTRQGEIPHPPIEDPLPLQNDENFSRSGSVTSLVSQNSLPMEELSKEMLPMINGLSVSQLKAPVSKMQQPRNGKKGGSVRDEALEAAYKVPLGEGGANIPRRIRR